MKFAVLKKKIVLVLAMLTLCAVGVRAQFAFAQNYLFENPAPESADSITVSLITCYPGPENYELYGHTMLRVVFTGYDKVFNYGIFNFNAPNFLYRFVKGECDYLVAAYPSTELTRGYEDRKIVEQVLNLSQEQARAVYAFLYENVKPQNATYHYDWAYDNCATRPRDIIEMASNNTIKYSEPQDLLTFRQIMEIYDANYPWQQVGIDLALGTGIDKTPVYRDMMFAPVYLMDAFSRATIEIDGEREPLVAETRDFVSGSDQGNIKDPTSWCFSPMAIFILLLCAVALICKYDIKHHRISKWFDSIFFGVAGLGGLLIAFLVFVSIHYGTSPNIHLLWLQPLHLLPAIFVWVKRARGWLFYYYVAAAVMTFVAIVAKVVVGQEMELALILLILTMTLRCSINALNIKLFNAK